MNRSVKGVVATKEEVVTNKGGLNRKCGLCKKTRGPEEVIPAKVVFAKRPEGGPENKEVLRRGGPRRE